VPAYWDLVEPQDGARRSIAGWPSFSVLTGVRSMNELLPLDRAGEAYDRMMSGKARFGVVLTAGA